jgi:hypothetical protein
MYTFLTLEMFLLFCVRLREGEQGQLGRNQSKKNNFL